MVTERTSFGQRLRRELDSQGVSVRELARRIRPDDPESGRRNIARWLAPRNRAVTPSRATINLVADVLGVDTKSLSADDEEDSPVAALFHALEAYVDHKLRSSSAVRA